MLSEKTRAEMRAGQAALTGKRPTGPLLMPEEDFDRMTAPAQRASVLAQWERAGLIVITSQLHFHPDDDHPERPPRPERHVHITIVKSGEMISEDPAELQLGGHPSELLMARVALALRAQGVV